MWCGVGVRWAWCGSMVSVVWCGSEVWCGDKVGVGWCGGEAEESMLALASMLTSLSA